jgi:hypothetical protein
VAALQEHQQVEAEGHHLVQEQQQVDAEGHRFSGQKSRDAASGEVKKPRARIVGTGKSPGKNCAMPHLAG